MKNSDYVLVILAILTMGTEQLGWQVLFVLIGLVIVVFNYFDETSPY